MSVHYNTKEPKNGFRKCRMSAEHNGTARLINIESDTKYYAQIIGFPNGGFTWRVTKSNTKRLSDRTHYEFQSEELCKKRCEDEQPSNEGKTCKSIQWKIGHCHTVYSDYGPISNSKWDWNFSEIQVLTTEPSVTDVDYVTIPTTATTLATTAISTTTTKYTNYAELTTTKDLLTTKYTRTTPEPIKIPDPTTTTTRDLMPTQEQMTTSDLEITQEPTINQEQVTTLEHTSLKPTSTQGPTTTTEPTVIQDPTTTPEAMIIRDSATTPDKMTFSESLTKSSDATITSKLMNTEQVTILKQKHLEPIKETYVAILYLRKNKRNDDEEDARPYKPIKKTEFQPEETEYAWIIAIPPFAIIALFLAAIIISDFGKILNDTEKGYRNVKSTVTLHA
ncbi:unnamed protein product [Owenia fusiformis]|uniref:Uncharacterized protein n=1 Tax=Owenia fusiformis TaxID=6347 RepID=A0A8S4NYJ2_OWEFU|nr:unnamed protein product [Owenia fusiformis]